jgi:hypothetical protein
LSLLNQSLQKRWKKEASEGHGQGESDGLRIYLWGTNHSAAFRAFKND